MRQIVCREANRKEKQRGSLSRLSSSSLLEFVNRGTGKRLAKRRIHRSAGLVSIIAPDPDVRVERGTHLALKWRVESGTGKKGRSMVLVSPDRKTWWPTSASTNSQSHRLDTELLEPGTYLYKVAVLDGIDVLTSNVAQFKITGR